MSLWGFNDRFTFWPDRILRKFPVPEVGGNAALYFDPLSVEAIEEAIEKIIFDVDLQKKMSEKSLIQSKQFSWDKTAQQTEEVYAKVLGL